MTQGTNLQGSEKQIAWAEKIRAEYIDLLRKLFGNPDAVEAVVMLETSAAWWIDNRGNGERDVLKLICEKYPEAIKAMSN